MRSDASEGSASGDDATAGSASAAAVVRAGIDAVALKPAEVDLRRAVDLPLPDLVVDFEGREHVPSTEVLEALAGRKPIRVTTPIRADGYDPLGDNSLLQSLPAGVGRVLVAGNPAYLTEAERARAIAPRLGAAREAAPEAWVGTEGVERLALAAGGTQFSLLSRSTIREVRGLRAAGFDGEIAVYAPTVLSSDPDAVLDAVGGYVSRRRPVRESLESVGKDSANHLATDGGASGRSREILLAAADDFALTGSVEEVRERVNALRDAGVDRVVGYPARGLEEFLE